MGELQTEIKYLKGVGPKRAELLESELGISTIGELIRLYPFRYIDRSSIQEIASVNQDVASIQVKGRVVSRTLYGPGNSIVPTDGEKIHFNAARRLSVIVEDETGRMEMVFFKGVKWNYERLAPGQTFIFFGRPSEFNGRYNIVHPEVDTPQDGNMSQGVLTGVYPSTERLKNAGITGKVMCRMQSAALALCLPEVTETLPDYVLGELGLCSLPYALKNIHFPVDTYALQKATRRLKFEELFLLQLSLLLWLLKPNHNRSSSMQILSHKKRWKLNM